MQRLVHTVAGRAPIVMSGAAILLLVIALTTGWERGATDEGVVAHSWQLLVFLQVPLIAVFVATADWSRPSGELKLLALQAALLMLAMAPVAILRL